MSTRSVIARKDGLTFKGVYHHWDGYPSGLGATLFGLRNGQYKGDTQAMLKALIDEHPAGWSTLNGDKRECYCHGGRAEEANPITEQNAAGCGCEWAYIFDGNGKMEIQSSFRRNGHKMIGMFGCGDPESVWKAVAIVDLDGQEPNWEAIEQSV